MDGRMQCFSRQLIMAQPVVAQAVKIMVNGVIRVKSQCLVEGAGRRLKLSLRQMNLPQHVVRRGLFRILANRHLRILVGQGQVAIGQVDQGAQLEGFTKIGTQRDGPPGQFQGQIKVALGEGAVSAPVGERGF